MSRKAITVLRRVVLDPGLLGEVLRKMRSRITYGFHKTRPLSESSGFVDVVDALSAILEIEAELVNRLMSEDRLMRRLRELEEWSKGPGASAGSGAGYLEMLYAIVRFQEPSVVLETGVASGFSTAVVLEALDANDQGRLISCDLPAFSPGASNSVGKAIPDDLRDSSRHSLLIGPDRKTIPKVVASGSSFDVVHYDSDKSYEGMKWALPYLWDALRPGGVLVFDDVQSNDAFPEFCEETGLEPLYVAKPSESGVYRSEREYIVGLLRKGTESRTE